MFETRDMKIQQYLLRYFRFYSQYLITMMMGYKNHLPIVVHNIYIRGTIWPLL